MTTRFASTSLRLGSPAQRAIYDALLRLGQREPQDFAFREGEVDFVMRREPRALAIIPSSEHRTGALEMRVASLRGRGIDLRVVEESEALRQPARLASRLVTGDLNA